MKKKKKNLHCNNNEDRVEEEEDRRLGSRVNLLVIEAHALLLGSVGFDLIFNGVESENLTPFECHTVNKKDQTKKGENKK